MRVSCSTASLKKPEVEFSPSALARVLFQDLRLPQDVLLKVAYSGGVDSHSLLHALARLRAAGALRVEAVHIDHRLQPASGEWARHCLQVCAELEVVCHAVQLDVLSTDGVGLEAAARQARYATLKMFVRPDDILVTAHQRDDQAETVLLHLLRGTGVRGLAGMPAIMDFGEGRLARPLLGFSRAAVHAYALAEGLVWVEDGSNDDTRFKRNRLRQQVMPMLEANWPGARVLLARNAGHMRESAELLDEVAKEDLSRCTAVFGGGRAGSDAIPAKQRSRVLSVSALQTMTASRRRNVLRYWIRTQGFHAPSTLHLDAIEAQICHQSRSSHACVRWPEAEVRRYRDALHVMPPLAAKIEPVDLSWDLAAPLPIPGTGYCLNPMVTVGGGLAHTRFGQKQVRVRLRRGGEECRLPGRDHHQKLKKLLQAYAIEPWLRERLPLVYVDDELAAVGDLWVCEPFAARSGESGTTLVWEPCLE